jgi:hypothetical protein
VRGCGAVFILEHMEESRRGGPSTTTRRPYYDRAERLRSARRAGLDPTEPDARFPHPPIAHSDGMTTIVGQLRAGASPRRCRSAFAMAFAST